MTTAVLPLTNRVTSLRGLAMSIRVVDALEAAWPTLAGHSVRVAAIAAAIAQVLGLDDDGVDTIRVAGRLHDIGKVGIRGEVLAKPGPLTPDERTHVQDHVRIGVQILSPVAELTDLVTAVREHHERLDGAGYPNRLRGEQISLGGRILAAADAFDAVTSPRPYREAKSRADALAHLSPFIGKHLDPIVFAALDCVVGATPPNAPIGSP